MEFKSIRLEKAVLNSLVSILLLIFYPICLEGVTKSYISSLEWEKRMNIILLGPGNTLGGPVAQVLIDHNWNDLKTKSEFVQNQEENPFVLSMGIDEQREMII